MKIFFDTEFIEDGKTIELISIGVVREDGKKFYAQNEECDLDRADDWVKQNVFPQLRHNRWLSRGEIAFLLVDFVGDKPEFWAYYADYDWVVLCQLYGRMIDLPQGWPKFCRDIKQLAGDKNLPQQPKKDEHDALADALWNKEMYELLTAGKL